jgi:alginate O-acetyltransferase complex protein AlgI
MIFSSPFFLFLFLPVVLGIYFLIPKRAGNIFLLGASLFFYAWGEQEYVLVLIVSISFNYAFGLLVGRWHNTRRGKRILTIAIVFNIGLLIIFKYANFLVDSLNVALQAVGLQSIELQPIHLPIGISFFTFHALSYVIDISRLRVNAQKNPIRIALYITMFPQLIAGPIVRYHDIASQIVTRIVTREGFADGVRRFIVGLGKKVLIANIVAVPADAIFAIPTDELTPGLAWLGIVCYTLQIYFDFSGYSDMAIGLGHMFGFTFLENFNYPYISQSIQEFWRRWHISLSNWFRDYLYIPLGGSRVSPQRTYFNLITVFFLCGLWHGASWTFAFWGLYHGLFMVIERLSFGRWLSALWSPLRHIYALLTVMIGWVFFRSSTLEQAWFMITAMFGFANGSGIKYSVNLYLDTVTILAILVGIACSTPILNYFTNWWSDRATSHPGKVSGLLIGIFDLGNIAILMLVFLLSAMQLAAGTHNPFIYFRF